MKTKIFVCSDEDYNKWRNSEQLIIIYMLLTIREEKEAIAREVKAIEQVGAQVSSQMCRFREFKQFKVIIGLI